MSQAVPADWPSTMRLRAGSSVAVYRRRTGREEVKILPLVAVLEGH